MLKLEFSTLSRPHVVSKIKIPSLCGNLCSMVHVRRIISRLGEVSQELIDFNEGFLLKIAEEIRSFFKLSGKLLLIFCAASISE